MRVQHCHLMYYLSLVAISILWLRLLLDSVVVFNKREISKKKVVDMTLLTLSSGKLTQIKH